MQQLNSNNSMENESDLPSPMCRLCLRVYSSEQLVEIFDNGSEDEQAIFTAVAIQAMKHLENWIIKITVMEKQMRFRDERVRKIMLSNLSKSMEDFYGDQLDHPDFCSVIAGDPLREDPTTRICVHCRHIVSLINSFKIACLQSDILLKNSSYDLESDAWSILNEIDIFRQAAELVERHQQDIDAITRKDDFDDDVVYDPEITPSELLPESVALIPDQIEDLIKVEFEGEDRIIGVQYVDSNDEHGLTDVQDLNLDYSLASDDHVKDETDKKDIASFDTGGQVVAPRRRRGRAKFHSKPDNREKVVCSTCGQLVSQQGLEGHQNRHLGVQPFACDIDGCEAKLHSKFALQQHRSRHKSTSRFYDCKVCGKRIKGTPYWLVHRKMHTEEPRFSCDICGKKFRRKCKLKLHSTVHSGLAEYPCEICGKFFTVKHNLTAHYRLHVKNGTYPPGFELSTTSEDVKTQEELSLASFVK